MIKSILSLFAVTALIHSLSFSASAQPTPPSSAPPTPPTANGALTPAAQATATLESKSGSKVAGTVSFAETGIGIKVEYHVTGLTKDRTYGFHIHEKGDCSSADAKSAGKHFMQVAPTGGTSLDNPQKYAGDLPSLKADQKGEANGNFVIQNLTVNKKNAITKLAVIIHDGPDDVSKKSATRIACGVIH